MEFSRQEYSSGLWFLSPRSLPDLGIELESPALKADSLPTEPPGWVVRLWLYIWQDGTSWTLNSFYFLCLSSSHRFGKRGFLTFTLPCQSLVLSWRETFQITLAKSLQERVLLAFRCSILRSWGARINKTCLFPSLSQRHQQDLPTWYVGLGTHKARPFRWGSWAE